MATQLPSEIIHQIVLCSLRPASFDDYRNPWAGDCCSTESKGLKKGLAHLSLTCRHWAVVFRPALFNSLVLRCANDLEQLAAILDYPALADHPLSPLIHDIGIKVDGTPQLPWLHHLPMLAKRLDPEACKQRHETRPFRPYVFLPLPFVSFLYDTSSPL